MFSQVYFNSIVDRVFLIRGKQAASICFNTQSVVTLDVEDFTSFLLGSKFTYKIYQITKKQRNDIFSLQRIKQNGTILIRIPEIEEYKSNALVLWDINPKTSLFQNTRHFLECDTMEVGIVKLH